MKTQLLEDINDIASQSPARPLDEARYSGPAGGVWRARPQPEPEVREQMRRPDLTEEDVARRAWRARPQPEPEVHEQMRDPDLTEENPERGAWRAQPQPEPEAREQARGPDLTEEDLAAFERERDEWLEEQIEIKPHWFDRWGRRVATWSAGVAGALLVAGGGLWMYRENRIDNTLVLVAKSATSAPKLAPAPQLAPVPAPTTVINVEPLGSPQQEEAPPEAVIQAAVSQTETQAETPVVARPSNPVLPKPVQAAKKRVSTKARPKAPVVVAELKPSRTGQMAETLRQCRVAGYHAAQCVKRGCVATKYGLACKG